jgi:hypothetical protein
MKSILTPSLYLFFKIYLRSGGEAALRLSAPTFSFKFLQHYDRL